MKWTRKRPGVYECEAGMVLLWIPEDGPSDWTALTFRKSGGVVWLGDWHIGSRNIYEVLANAQAAVEAHAKEAEG